MEPVHKKSEGRRVYKPDFKSEQGVRSVFASSLEQVGGGYPSEI